MPGSIPHVLTMVFSITTVVVFLVPIVKLTPSWLERSMAKRIIFHRSAIIALGEAMAVAGDDAARARLDEQLSYHRAAIAALVPGERGAPAAPARVDEAA